MHHRLDLSILQNKIIPDLSHSNDTLPAGILALLHNRK